MGEEATAMGEDPGYGGSGHGLACAGVEGHDLKMIAVGAATAELSLLGLVR